MKLFKKIKLPMIFPLLAILVLAGFGCKGGSQKAQQAAQPVVLNWWMVGNTTTNVQPLLADYKAVRPNVTVIITQVRQEELSDKLTTALADGVGPDIVSLPNTWLRSWQHRLAPLPPTLTLPYLELSGYIKKEPKWVFKEIESMDYGVLRSRYVDVVVDDVYIDNKIYGLPLHLDTLMVFYNIDLLTSAQYPQPPTTWSGFKDAAQKITRLDKHGTLLQNGAALGTADNIPYAFDILSALMLQNGTPMMNINNTQTTFHEPINIQGQIYSPGVDAIRFYTDFANPTKETYSWSLDEPQAREAFASGKLGFLFGYWRDLPTLKLMAPRVRIGYANFPQIDGSLQNTYYANYYIETVTKQSQHQNEAWDLIQFMMTPDENKKYLATAKVAPAQRDFVTAQLNDLELGVPSTQVLTAKSWYRGYNIAATENYFLNMIRQVLGGTSFQDALSFAASQINYTLYRPIP